MQPIVVSVGPLAAADNNGICESQNPGTAGNLTLNGVLVSGGVAQLGQPRRVLITNAGNDSARTFTVYGTTFGGVSISENVLGTNGSSIATVQDFLTVTQVYVNGGISASGVIVGTNGVAGTRWVRLDSWANNNTAIQCSASGTVNYTVQVTMDDPNSATDPVAPVDVTWINTNDSDAVTATSDIFTNFQFTPTFARVLLNSGSGTVTATFAQFNVVNL